MEEGKQTLKEYMDEYCIPTEVLLKALENGIIGKTWGTHYSELHLVYRNDNWCLANDAICTPLSQYGEIWILNEKKKTYAEVKCSDLDCDKCPIRKLTHVSICSNTLQEILDRMYLDDEEREFYQKRINKEYKEG